LGYATKSPPYKYNGTKKHFFAESSNSIRRNDVKIIDKDDPLATFLTREMQKIAEKARSKNIDLDFVI